MKTGMKEMKSKSAKILKTALTILLITNGSQTALAQVAPRRTACQDIANRAHEYYSNHVARIFREISEENESQLREFLRNVSRNPNTRRIWNNYVREVRAQGASNPYVLVTNRTVINLMEIYSRFRSIHGGLVSDVSCQNNGHANITYERVDPSILAVGMRAAYAQVRCNTNEVPNSYRAWTFSGIPNVEIRYSIPRGRIIDLPDYVDPVTGNTVPGFRLNVTRVTTDYPLTMPAIQQAGLRRNPPSIQVNFSGQTTDGRSFSLASFSDVTASGRTVPAATNYEIPLTMIPGCDLRADGGNGGGSGGGIVGPVGDGNGGGGSGGITDDAVAKPSGDGASAQ